MYNERRKAAAESVRVQQELEDVKAKEKAIENIPFLFDNTDFSELSVKLFQLARSGVKEIKIGNETYSTDDLEEIFQKVNRYSLDNMRNGGKQTEEEIDAFLAGIGVTRAKISDASKYGFRESLKKAIKEDMFKRTFIGGDLGSAA